MSIYKGKPVVIARPVDEVFARVSDFAAYQQRLEQLPDDVRAKLGNVQFADDTIVINTPPVGEIRFKVTRKDAPSALRLEAEQSPVPFAISIGFEPKEEASTEVSSNIDVDIPMMLRPLVGSKMQEAADKFSELISVFAQHA